MENPTETLPETQVNGPDPPNNPETSASGDGLLAELESLRQSHQALLSKSVAMDEDSDLIRQQRDDALARNNELTKVVGEISGERESLRDEIQKLEGCLREKEDGFDSKLEEELKLKEVIENEVRVCRETIERLELERKERDGFLLKCLDSLRSIKEGIIGIIDCVGDEKVGNGTEEAEGTGAESESDPEWRAVYEEIAAVARLTASAEAQVSEYKELRKKEKKELENSVVSLTEENRDISSLLRVALAEKEAVVKRLKGSEQKRVPILQRVGFGFIMGSGGNEQSPESSGDKLDGAGSTAGSKSDGSDCEEGVISLASTVEKIMKNLRLEITQLRRSLDESRSDTERLQSLAEKQAQQISENTQYIKELENRERVLTQNVEELMIEIKESEAEVARWREACELEVEAGKTEIGEREKVIAILKQELEKTKAALDISNGKLKMKEELAATAMAAQAAAERSLQLADSRASGLRARIEELTKQVEEAESRERNNRRVRHICWPWRLLKASNNAQNSIKPVRRFLPEMQALLHYSG
ncbi:hypothetical protein ACFX13_002037 [Malus domestica]|uniref:uncharacterized protein At3g49055-like n=1 Tax=Malus domestica TaxID=3750 RepID=UPI0010AA4D16|nr:uncharacterized protein At3g49055-like [Malus domestica]XP_050140241.1 uncharacterized protein At3g49055-like [Malus sylvestris]